MNKYQAETESLLTALEAAGFTLLTCRHEYPTQAVDVSRADFVAELMACDESTLLVSHPSHPRTMSLFLVYGNSPGELVSDYSAVPVLDAVITAESQRWEASSSLL